MLVNKENYFTFQPMLSEIIGGSLGVYDTVNSLRDLLKHTALYIREVVEIDTKNKKITLSPKFSHVPLELPYEHLAVCLGNVTDFRTSESGLHEHALPFKNLSDTILIKNHLIDAIESASVETDPILKKQLLTVVVGGGGYSGVEAAAEINDYFRDLAHKYPSIDPKDVEVHLIHSKERLMNNELPESLSRYTEKLLRKKGVIFHFFEHLQSASPNEAICESGLVILSKTIISTVPSSPNPLIEDLDIPKEKGKLKTDPFCRVEGVENVWSCGDCAWIPLPEDNSKPCPPTAQYAIREARCLAKNIVATIKQGKLKKFQFKCLGSMAALGDKKAVGELFGFIKVSGFIAWLLWRAIYWMKLPGVSRKIKVLISWLLDFIFPSPGVQIKTDASSGVIHLHFEKNETIFHEGDIGDYLYLIAKGSIEVVKNIDGEAKQLATLGAGEYFGEMAILGKKRRNATIKTLEPTNLIAIREKDFHTLITHSEELKNLFKQKELKRNTHLKEKGFND